MLHWNDVIFVRQQRFLAKKIRYALRFICIRISLTHTQNKYKNIKIKLIFFILIFSHIHILKFFEIFQNRAFLINNNICYLVLQIIIIHLI